MRIDGREVGRRGILFIVSGPSGAGKTSLSDQALATLSGLELSVSVTTRLPREGEIDGRDYRFVTRESFDEMLEADRLAEWAEVHGNCYGTPREPMDEALAAGRDLLLDIDVQGARQIKNAYPEAVAIFLLPPGRVELETRLSGRGTESREVVEHRLANACREIAALPAYDYVIVNHVLKDAFAEFEAIVGAERGRRDRIDEQQWRRIIRAFEGGS